MVENALRSYAADSHHPRYEELIARKTPLYAREGDLRSPFVRDYNRIIHSLAYRRLKHKTQVFFNVANDHICTRIEHVQHVESVSRSIAEYLGLNIDLTCAIATGHDLGHAPFGHQGEKNLQKLSDKYLRSSFWHEKNGLRFVDTIELLENDAMRYRNMDLTYAVRDGIISHCGEIDERQLKPRENLCDLDEFVTPGQMQPATWEGCVVKLADKISYLGRDISDAISLGFLGDREMSVLRKIGEKYDSPDINTSLLMHKFISDVSTSSNPEDGICMSDKFMSMMDEIKAFNYEFIYLNPKQETFCKYAELILTELFDALRKRYRGKDTIAFLEKERVRYPQLCGGFVEFIGKYVTLDISQFEWSQKIIHFLDNEKIYGDLSDEGLYIQAIIDFLSGMTDSFAIRLFEDLITY